MKRPCLALLLAAYCATLNASVTIDLSGGQLLTATGVPLPDGALIQLLGTPSGNNFAGPSAASFTGGSSNDIVLASFGLNSSSTGTAGSFEQVITLSLSSGLSAGDELLLRWYPTLTAASTAPGSGTSYGQFRTDFVQDGSDIAWIVPGDGATDSLVFSTASQGGSQPDSAGQASLTASDSASAVPRITSPTTSEVVLGQPFSYAIVATRTPTSFQASGLPPGLSIDAASGLISGTPAQTGIFNVTLSASNAGGTGTAALSLTIDPPPAVYPVITSTTTATILLGQAFNYQIVATNSPAAFGASGLPDPLSINSSTGVISGTPTQSGVFNIGLSASNSIGTGTAQLALTVSPVPVVAPAITSVLSANAEANTASFSYQIVGTNLPGSYGASGLPAGLDVNTASGLISGIPTTVGTYQVTLSAANSAGAGTAVLSLTVAAAPVAFPAITSPATAGVLLGQPFSYSITATANPTFYGASGLPDGVGIDASTGLISGTPKQSGVFNAGLSATNANGTGTIALTLTVNPKPASAPVISSVLGVNAEATVAFNYQITASELPSLYDASGLPAGLSINPASGLISGVPGAAGVYSMILSASNAAGTGTATLTLNVAAAPLPVVEVTATVPKIILGTGAVGKFTVTLAQALPQDLPVNYALKGTAKNGRDYERLVGTKTIKAGRTKANIKIVPLGDLGGAPKKVVTFILESGKDYALGTTTPVKVKIFAGK